MKRAREARKKNRKRGPSSEAVRATLRFLGLAFSVSLALDAIILALASIPPNYWSALPRWIMDGLAYPDYRQIVSQGLVEVPIGVFISSFIWKILGDRKQNIIGESEAMMKHYHLKLTDRDKKPFIINLETKQGYPLPFYLQGVANEGIIQEAKDSEIKDATWNKQEPTPKELGL